MKIAIVGASGFVGLQVTRLLLATTPYQLTLFSHKSTKLHYTPAQERRLTHIDGNVLKPEQLNAALHKCDLVIYLVHLMGDTATSKDFLMLEKQAATNLANAVTLNNVRRVIYVGGMSDKSGKLTKHLQSRATTGAIIRRRVPQLIELRTPMIIGPGGAGFEVLKALVQKLPVLPLPHWARAITQPITVHDVARYVVASITLETSGHQTVDIGGPERLSYAQIAQRYAIYRGKRLLILPVPYVPKGLAKFVLARFAAANYAATVADMIDSAGYSAVSTSPKAKRLFPAIKPEVIDSAFKAN